MADGNYARLVAACFHEKPLFPTTGRERKACFACWPGAGEKERTERAQKQCAGCGAGIARRMRYCDGCAAIRMAERRKRPRQSKQQPVLCHWCHCYTRRRVSGGDHDLGKYCDRQCAAAHRSKVAQEIAGIRRLVPVSLEQQQWPSIRALMRVPRGLLSQKKRAESAQARADVPCLMCGKPCGYTFGRTRLYCSEKCYRSSPVQRTSRRIHRAMRKAKQRAVTVERVDPLRVLERDRWRCQLCGIKTPRTKRGTLAANAPEVDHIVPLALGGEHSYRNVQCACRGCNASKAATVRGQFLLIG